MQRERQSVLKRIRFRLKGEAMSKEFSPPRSARQAAILEGTIGTWQHPMIAQLRTMFIRSRHCRFEDDGSVPRRSKPITTIALQSGRSSCAHSVKCINRAVRSERHWQRRSFQRTA
jgi:hypothetical protein